MKLKQSYDKPEGQPPIAGSAICSATPRKFYWSQCYQLDGNVHWALRDTLTDSQSPPERVTCLEMILEAHAPDIFGRPLENEPFPKLIAELLNAHFAKSPNIRS